MVADNDLAVGKMVDLISHSPYWKDSAIFITEDDAQNGLDHVDGHREPAFVISPWVKRSKKTNPNKELILLLSIKTNWST